MTKRTNGSRMNTELEAANYGKLKLTGVSSGISYVNRQERIMTLLDGNVGEEYIIKSIQTEDEELDAFLFSLGCYSGEPITVVSRLKGGCVVSIKDGRYTIDNELASAILI